MIDRHGRSKNNLKCCYSPSQVLWSEEKSILSTFWQHLPLATTSKSLDRVISVWTVTTTQLIVSPLVHVRGVIVTSILDGLRSKESSIRQQKNPNFQDFWEFDACSDSRYQALFSSFEREIQCSTQVWNPTPVSLSNDAEIVSFEVYGIFFSSIMALISNPITSGSLTEKELADAFSAKRRSAQAS